MSYFIKPELVTLEDYTYYKDYRTYSEYNYLRPGFITYLKTRHFEYSLALTREYFHNCNVIDFGCGDGIFLPSLAKYFNQVTGVDKIPEQISIASKVCEKRGLNNVRLICNDSLSLEQLRQRVGPEKYRLLYLLETLEHVGDKDDLYPSKIAFLKMLFSLIDPQGIVVVSVPVMVGIPFLFTRLGQHFLGRCLEKAPLPDLLRASFFCDTKALEKRWKGGHLGFNHRKFEISLRGSGFKVLKKKDLFFHIVYLIGK